MAQTDTRSLQQIKRETELTRAGLMDTVEQLRTSVSETANDIRERISPTAIKAEVSDYIRSRGEHLLEDVSAAARKNPMQAVAVGASIAYPLLRLARTVPLPVLMVGAGVFLAGSRAGQAATQKASDVVSDLSDEVVRRAHDLGDRLGESATAARSVAADKLDRLSEAVSGVTDAMADREADIKHQGERIAGSAAESARDIGAGAASVGRKVAGTTKDAGMEAARSVREAASDLSDRARKTFFETIEQNPLLVAGVGLAVGGLIASALPRSDIEDGLVGETSNSIKRRAQAAAAQAYDEATRQAEGLGKAARDVGQRVRRVADTAVTTAFEPPEDDINQSGAQGDTHHG